MPIIQIDIDQTTIAFKFGPGLQDPPDRSAVIDFQSGHVSGRFLDQLLWGEKVAILAAILATSNGQFSKNVLPTRKAMRAQLLHELFELEASSAGPVIDGNSVKFGEFRLELGSGLNRKFFVEGGHELPHEVAVHRAQYWVLLCYAALKMRREAEAAA